MVDYHTEPAQRCPISQFRAKLKRSGLRPTRQRLALGWLLFAHGHKHWTAESLHEEVLKAKIPVSLATIYNTLHQFKEAGLIKSLLVHGHKSYFDTNLDDHYHYFIESENRVLDIERFTIPAETFSDLPEGMEVASIEVVVRLKPNRFSRERKQNVRP